jgi:uncharacterized protein (TIGR02453 family)
MGKAAGPFGPGLVKFLRELERNNDRRWFDENKERYEAEVREPAREFIRAMAPHVERISPYLLADDRKVGGSMMRIYRDVRFSRDKSPFKTNLGIQFRHEAGKDIHAPGLYFHVEPGVVFLGAGMWRPDSASLSAVRETIDRDPKGWKRVRDGKRFQTVWELTGDSLKRPPRGYEADHPMIEDLRRKDWIAGCDVSVRDVTRADLVKLVADHFGRARGYLAWLAEAIGMPF